MRPDGSNLELVVAAYDGSDEAAVAVRWAADIASRASSALRVVWAWKLRDVWDDGVAAHRGDFGALHLPQLAEVAHRSLARAVRKIVPHHEVVQLRLVQGPDAPGIVLAESAEADLLVMGSRGRGRAATALLGSTSAFCLRRARCPILITPHSLVVPPHDGINPLAAHAEVVARRQGAL
jgi:nucleotide-binding universal stress UspA family protein